MARKGNWIEPFPEGIYVRPADAWVDPSQPKPRALVTQGHADHADWDKVAPKEVWIAHGREDTLMHWCLTHQIEALDLNLVGYEDEDD